MLGDRVFVGRKIKFRLWGFSEGLSKKLLWRARGTSLELECVLYRVSSALALSGRVQLDWLPSSLPMVKLGVFG